MEEPISRATIINLQHLPFIEGQGKVVPISRSIRRALENSDNRNFELPPLATLKAHYNCTHLDMYDALRILRGDGIDFSFEGLDEPLYMWRTQ